MRFINATITKVLGSTTVHTQGQRKLQNLIGQLRLKLQLFGTFPYANARVNAEAAAEYRYSNHQLLAKLRNSMLRTSFVAQGALIVEAVSAFQTQGDLTFIAERC